MEGKIGIIYSTVDGQTLKICERLNAYFIDNQIQTELYSIDDFNSSLSEFHTLVIGASIRYGIHNEKISQFIQSNKNRLSEINTAFFSVNLVARKENKNLASTNPYLLKFLKKTDWKPDFLDVFAGKLDYKSYPFFDRIMIKLIMKFTNGPTKTDEPIEYTDWKRVDNFGLTLIENFKSK